MRKSRSKKRVQSGLINTYTRVSTSPIFNQQQRERYASMLRLRQEALMAEQNVFLICRRGLQTKMQYEQAPDDSVMRQQLSQRLLRLEDEFHLQREEADRVAFLGFSD